MSIHDDVKEALAELQEEAQDLEQVAGHELVKLYNAAKAATHAIRASRRGQEFVGQEIKAGAGAIEDPLHPETAATEARPESSDELQARAEREPDPTVREKVAEAASERAAEERKASSSSASKTAAKKK